VSYDPDQGCSVVTQTENVEFGEETEPPAADGSPRSRRRFREEYVESTGAGAGAGA
jgi:hypothetical protein